VGETGPAIEFVDRSVALASKAVVSFFPLVIVVAWFAPPRIRTSIFTSLTPIWLLVVLANMALLGGLRDLLADGAPPALPAPTRDLRLRDAFQPTEEGT